MLFISVTNIQFKAASSLSLSEALKSSEGLSDTSTPTPKTVSEKKPDSKWKAVLLIKSDGEDSNKDLDSDPGHQIEGGHESWFMRW